MHYLNELEQEGIQHIRTWQENHPEEAVLSQPSQAAVVENGVEEDKEADTTKSSPEKTPEV